MADREKELAYSLFKFQKALKRLAEALAKEDDDLKVDASIQRFEFTFELAWKTMKRALLVEGIYCRTPRECLREGFRLGLIVREDDWLAMLDDRNAMSYIYSEEEAQTIFSRLPVYQQAFESLLNTLRKQYDL